MAQLHHPHPFMHHWLELHPALARLLSKEVIALLVVLLVALAGALYMSSLAGSAAPLDASGLGEGSERSAPAVPALNPAGDYQPGAV